MQPILVAVVYGSALVLALALLYFFHAKWYWHALSAAGAFVVGLMPPIEGAWRPPDLLVGFVFVFLFVWGLGAPLFRAHHHPPRSRVERHA
jgi:hypothetical protein